MKTKIGLFLLFGIFYQFTSHAQVIVGPEFLCLGECGYYEVLDANGNQIIDDLVWNAPDGFTVTGPTMNWCPWWDQGTITVSTLDGVIIAQFQFWGTECCFIPIVDGPSELCVGECGYYQVTGGGSGGYEWYVSDGSVLQSGEWCPSAIGTYSIVVTDFNGCSSTMDVIVTEVVDPDIISLSGGFCLDDSLSNCDRVCENTTVTYTIPVNNPGIAIDWFVSGAENWVENGNEVTVEWGDPGQGQVSVVVGDPEPEPWFISCGQMQEAFMGESNGIGFVHIGGPMNSFYNISLSSGQNQTGVGNFANTLDNLVAGVYTVTVTDQNGITQSCEFVIGESTGQCPAFGVAFDITAPSDCNNCDGVIEPIHLAADPNASFVYLWTGPNGFLSTVQTLTGVCAGQYSLTITDAFNGCTTSTYGMINCNSTNSCSGSNSICVDILEIPTAAFETSPPAVNGVIEICQGQTVFFDNQTNGAFNYTWDFGNSVSSSLVDAEHTYLTPGTFEAILIARNDCFCGDSTAVTIIVEEALTPEIDCAGTICPGEQITYTSNADCSTFYWNVSANGTILSGGTTSDDFITVDWGAGPEGIIELSVDGCVGDYCLQTLVENIPIIDDNAEIQGPERVCKGAEVIYSMPAFAGTEFVWTVSGFGTITDGQGSNEITVQWANQVTSIQQQITVVYESCYLGCGGEDILLVNILNEVFIEGPIEVCPDEAAVYTCKTPLGNSVQANWTVTDNTGTIVASSASVTSDFTWNGNVSAGTYTVHAEVQNPSGYCIDNFSVFVDVVAETALPTSITGSLEICPGTSYTYTGNSASGGFSYTWYVSDGGSNYILNGKTVNIIWGASPPYVLGLTQTNLQGLSCESESIEISPTIVNSVALSGIGFLCPEETGTYTATGYENLEYNWQISPADAGSIIGGENTNEVTIQWHASGNHNIQVAVCGASDVLPITVYQRPDPDPVYTEVCPGQTTPVSLTLPYNGYEWRNDNGTLLSTSATTNLGTGYYEVIVTDNNGCTQNETFFIGTFGQPDVTISTPDFGNFCENGGTMTLYALETSSGPLDYQWFRNGVPFGINSSAQVISQEGVYYVMVTDINGCTDNSNSLGLDCNILSGGGNPQGCTPDGLVDFSISQGVYCNESQYTNMSVNDAPSTWSWEFLDIVGGGTTYSNLENPTHTWTNAGFNLVIFRAGIYSTPPGQICLMETYSFDTIPLAADFIFEGACPMEPVSFTDISTFIPQTNITGWLWDFGDPASGINNTSGLQNPQHIYNASGFYTVTLTATDLSGCISQKQMTVEISIPPLASFSIPDQGCEGTSLFFQADGTFTDATWDFGDPGSGTANVSNIEDTYHVFDNPGVYTVSLTVENVYGCIETVTEQVSVEANGLTGSISVNPATEVCEGDSVILRAPMADAYSWSNGFQTQEITVFEAGNYQVSIFDAIGCAYATPSVTIDLIPLPQGQITAIEYNEYGQPIDYFYNNYETCYGEDVYLEITDNPNYTYLWSTGDTNTDISFTDDKENLLEIGTHIFSTTITDTNTGCTNVIGPFTVTVHPIPENIIISSVPSAPVCENTPTVISVFNPDPSYTYVWNTGQSGTSINTFYAGKYFVRAINQFGCEAESNTLEIVPGPNLDLIPSGCHTRCNPDTICLPPVTGIASFQWYLNGAPIPAPQGNDPDYIAMESGEYYVEMVSDAGCVSISDVLTLDLYDGFGSVQGNVYFDLNENGVIDAADTLMTGIGVILQNNGINVDTLISNQIGSFSFANILSTDYELIIDEANLPPGMTAIINQADAQLFGCDDEEMVEFLIQFICIPIDETLTLSACSGETVEYDGVDLDIGDTQQFTFSSSIGCDSMVTVSVVELDQDSISIQLSACVGTTVDYDGTDLNPGTQTDFMYSNSNGCDSIVTVIVGTLQNYSMTENMEACSGESVNYDGTDLLAGTSMTFNYTTVDNCDSTVTVIVAELLENTESIELNACDNSSVIYDGTELLPGSTTDFAFTNTSGCDSIVTVVVNPLQSYSMTENMEACTGETVNFNGTDLLAGTTMTFNLTTVDNCDSSVTVIVAELLEAAENIALNACENSSVFYDGTELLPGSTTDFTFSNVSGCDSVVTVFVETLLESTNMINLQACAGSTIDYNGTPLPGGTVMDFTFSNAVGCDSVVTVSVAESDQDSISIQLSACIGATVDYNGTSLDPDTQTDFMYSNDSGCDSVVTVIVNALQNYSMTENLEACTGETINYDGTAILAGTTMTFNYTTIGNCDSTVTVVVAALAESIGSVQLDACENSSVVYNGTELLPGSSTDFTFSNAVGCDSIVTVEVQSLFQSAETVALEACNGSTVLYNGTPLNPGSSTEFMFTNAAGCDSMVTVEVAELPLYDLEMEFSACEGGSVEYNGEDLAAGSVTQFMFISSEGCDSAMTVMVASISESFNTINTSACEGENYMYNGNAIAAGSSADFVMTNAEGCDSTVTVIVASLSIIESAVDLFVCSGESITYNGMELFEDFEEEVILVDLNGCDSIVSVRVEAYPVFDFEVANEAACWNENNGAIYIENLTGGTGPFQFGIDGQYQDSMTFANIADGTFAMSVMDANGCVEVLETEVNEISPLQIAEEIPEIPCDFSTVRLDSENLSENSGAVSYLWSNGSIESFIDIDTPGVYTVEIVNACEVLQKEYTVRLAADGRANYFYVPNVFSPNDDGMNDLWKIMPPDDMEVLSFELLVFDRWGNHLKTFNTVDDTWDGSFKNKNLDPGVYVWWYQANVLSCGRSLTVYDEGDVTVIR